MSVANLDDVIMKEKVVCLNEDRANPVANIFSKLVYRYSHN